MNDRQKDIVRKLRDLGANVRLDEGGAKEFTFTIDDFLSMNSYPEIKIEQWIDDFFDKGWGNIQGVYRNNPRQNTAVIQIPYSKHRAAVQESKNIVELKNETIKTLKENREFLKEVIRGMKS